MYYKADKQYSFHFTKKGINKYEYFNEKEEANSLAYTNIYMIDYDLLKLEKYYVEIEQDYINKGYNFKESFTNAYEDYYELKERINEFYIIPQQYFHQIIDMSDIEINPGFKIASIDYIKSNIENKGYGTILLNEIENFLKENGFKTIAIQLLNNTEKLINFYKKNGFKELNTTKNIDTNCLFMYKNI
jgi:GNAT superfamily N-acetyltransferase